MAGTRSITNRRNIPRLKHGSCQTTVMKRQGLVLLIDGRKIKLPLERDINVCVRPIRLQMRQGKYKYKISAISIHVKLVFYC